MLCPEIEGTERIKLVAQAAAQPAGSGRPNRGPKGTKKKKIGLWSHKSCGTVITSLPQAVHSLQKCGKTSVVMVSLMMLKKSEERPAYTCRFFKCVAS